MFITARHELLMVSCFKSLNRTLCISPAIATGGVTPYLSARRQAQPGNQAATPECVESSHMAVMVGSKNLPVSRPAQSTGEPKRDYMRSWVFVYVWWCGFAVNADGLRHSKGMESGKDATWGFRVRWRGVFVAVARKAQRVFVWRCDDGVGGLAGWRCVVFGVCCCQPSWRGTDNPEDGGDYTVDSQGSTQSVLRAHHWPDHKNIRLHTHISGNIYRMPGACTHLTWWRARQLRRNGTHSFTQLTMRKMNWKSVKF